MRGILMVQSEDGKEKALIQIRQSIRKLGEEEPGVTAYAEDIFRRAQSSKSMSESRISDQSIIASIVYIAFRKKSDRKITQTDICYHFNVSPMTLRKAYSKICDVLNIDRKSVNRLNVQLPEYKTYKKQAK
jgi:transcription initiation factor TFIIIB Brf1 subunit/transcription initiation factor TFIIB